MAEGPPLQLHDELSGISFTHDGPEKGPVYDWFSLDPAFEGVLERHPRALEQARKAVPFHTAQILSLAGAPVFFVKGIASTSSEDDLRPADVDSADRDFTIMLGFGVATIVWDALANRYLERGAATFNAAEEGVSREGAGPMERALRSVSVVPLLEPVPGGRFGVAARLPLR